jgi:hypothetical protein
MKINRQIAAGIDQRVRQLAGQNLSDSALVDQMVGYIGRPSSVVEFDHG